MSESIINRDKKTLTHKEYLTEKYRPLVLLVREMEKTIGKAKAYEIVAKTFYDDMFNWVTEELEELDLKVMTTKYILSIKHFYTNFIITLHVLECKFSKYPKTNRYKRWLSYHELVRYPLPSGTAKVVDKIHSMKYY